MPALFDLKDHGITVAESTAIYLPASCTSTPSATRRRLASPKKARWFAPRRLLKGLPVLRVARYLVLTRVPPPPAYVISSDT